eukprot:TRINITY_DN11111_c0_g1_i1.p1 TRINITY_DN11111_c0_g1~~TRINITY_DN11111_c0_g1_i1.p1  ORF type:complete len:429 (-),score=64.51 TRINITY_DN11111_c0_g1_i1:105-1334(-)
MGGEDSIQSYGKAQVGKPETVGTSIAQYTTYLVQVELNDESLSCRKRYSDFEWLRTTLVASCPGVRVPPLPKKQRTGRFEDTFIEARRSGLELFLQRCLKRRQLCIDMPAFKKFLETTTEEAMESLKTEFSKMTVSSKFELYKEAFASDIQTAESSGPPSEERIVSCKRFLDGEVTHLRELAEGFRDVVDAQLAVSKALAGAQKRLTSICGHESDAFANAGISEKPRAALVAGFRQQSEALVAAPSMHYDLLLTETETELLEAEALQEAFESVERLHADMHESISKVEHLTSTLKKVMDGGEIPSTGTGVARMLGMAPKKDRDQKIAEMKADLEQRKKDTTCLEELHKAARAILLSSEIDSFFREKLSAQKKSKESFAGNSQKMAERLAQVWGEVRVATKTTEPSMEWE